MPLDPSQAPIHVIGTGRSGTTLLRMMLSAHPRIHLTHEASFYVWEALWGRRDPALFPSYYLHTPHFRWLRLDPDLVLDDLPAPFAPEHRALLYTAVMRAAAARRHKPRWGDKTPSHSGSLRRIFEDWPDARVVRIVRDPRATVHSLTRMPWATASLVGASGFCELERRQVEPYRDRILQIRLEDLLEHPKETMAAVLDHVGEPWSDQVLDHPRFGPDDLPPVPWFARAMDPPRGDAPSQSPPRWSKDWAPEEVRLVEHINRHTLREFGYPPASLPQDVSTLRRWTRHLRDLPEVFRSLWLTLRLGLLARHARHFEGIEQKRLFRRLNPAAWDRMPGFDGIPDAPALPATGHALTAPDDLP